jgi:hypothetical protein
MQASVRIAWGRAPACKARPQLRLWTRSLCVPPENADRCIVVDSCVSDQRGKASDLLLLLFPHTFTTATGERQA